MKHRILLVSDMHYTTEETHAEMKAIDPSVNTSAAAGDAFGHTQKQKVEKIYEAICAEHEKAPLDAVLVLGDLSVDDYNFRNLPNYCRRFKEEVMDRLPCPAWALAGNHDSYPDEMWQEVFGYGRQYAVEIGGAVFAMADTFRSVPATGASGAPYTALDKDFLQETTEKYAGKPLFLCAHHIREGGESDEVRNIVRTSDTVCMFRGHTHFDGVIATGEIWGHKPLVDIGGYAYNGVRTPEGKWVFSRFSFAWAWGYQILEWEDGGDTFLTYHVKPAYRYVAENGIFETVRTVSSVMELPRPQ